MAHLEHELLALIRSHYHQPQPTEQEAAESLKRLRVGLTPWLAQPVKTLFAVRCKTLDRLDYGTAF